MGHEVPGGDNQEAITTEEVLRESVRRIARSRDLIAELDKLLNKGSGTGSAALEPEDDGVAKPTHEVRGPAAPLRRGRTAPAPAASPDPSHAKGP